MPFVKRANTQEVDASLAQLAEIGKRWERQSAALVRLSMERDLAIREATRVGATRRDVAHAARLTAARVQQIVDS